MIIIILLLSCRISLCTAIVVSPRPIVEEAVTKLLSTTSTNSYFGTGQDYEAFAKIILAFSMERYIKILILINFVATPTGFQYRVKLWLRYTTGPYFVAFPELKESIARNIPIYTKARSCTVLPNFVGSVFRSKLIIVSTFWHSCRPY